MKKENVFLIMLVIVISAFAFTLTAEVTNPVENFWSSNPFVMLAEKLDDIVSAILVYQEIPKEHYIESWEVSAESEIELFTIPYNKRFVLLKLYLADSVYLNINGESFIASDWFSDSGGCSEDFTDMSIVFNSGQKLSAGCYSSNVKRVTIVGYFCSNPQI